MKPAENQTSRGFKRFELVSFGRVGSLLAISFWALSPGGGNGALKAEAQVALLEFNQPTNNAVFSTLDEVPILLRGFARDDVFPAAELFSDGGKVADLSYCCALCPCAAPQTGRETLLQIPAPWSGVMPPPEPFHGWTNVPAGVHRLTARAVGQQGTRAEAEPVTITVVDRRLEILKNTDGTLTLVIPQGSLTPGAFDLEASEDLRAWTRLGAFEPGNVAAFYFRIPMERAWRFYRSLYIPRP